MGRVDLGSSGANLSATFTAKRTLRVIVNVNGTSTASSVLSLRFNGDTGANYSVSQYTNGSHNTALSSTSILLDPAQNQYNRFITVDINNVANQSKRLVWHEFQDGGATIASAPQDRIAFGIWGNTSAQVTTLTIADTVGSGTLNAGSYLIILGHN